MSDVSEAYVTLRDVTYCRPLPSGNSFEIEFEGRSYVIPSFAVGADSEIWVGCVNETTGALILFERIAKEKGLLGGPTGGTEIGIPLKRHRLPDPIDLIELERIKEIKAGLVRIADAGGSCQRGTELVRPRSDELIAVFEEEADADFFAAAPGALLDLVEENLKLRIWVETVTKARHR